MRAISVLVLSVLLAPSAWAAEAAPPFSLAGQTGEVKLESLRGKVVYLDFWASWCGPCRESFPWMNSLQQRFQGKGLEVVAINLDKTRDLADDFLKQIPASFRIAFDPTGSSASAYKVKGMPSSYLIDRSGHVHTTHIGFHKKNIASIESEIEALLARK